MKYDPNVYGYVNGKPTYSRDEFIFTVRGFGPIENDADLLAFAEKATSRWYNAGWHQTLPPTTSATTPRASRDAA